MFQNYTLTIVFNKSCDKVLMCWHEKWKAFNFIGGKIKEGEENGKDASYRELFEETGIPRSYIDLLFVRNEFVYGNRYLYKDDWELYITYGILKDDVELISEKNELVWMDINDSRIDKELVGYGNCRVFLNEALKLIELDSK